jgi:hypothetical protein
MLGDQGISVVRTLVPVAAGFIITVLLNLGIDIGAEGSVALNAFLTSLFTAVWYVIARLLEDHVSEKFGWMLLLPKKPTY